MVLGLGEMGGADGRLGRRGPATGRGSSRSPRRSRARFAAPRRTRPAARSRSCGSAGTPDRRGPLSLRAISRPRHVSTSATAGSPPRGTSGRRPCRRRRTPSASRPAAARRSAVCCGVKSPRAKLARGSGRCWPPARASSANCSFSSTMLPVQRSAEPGAGASSRARNLPLLVAEAQQRRADLLRADRLAGRPAHHHVGLGQGLGQLPQLVLRQIGQHDRRVVLSGRAAEGFEHGLARRRDLELRRWRSARRARRPGPLVARRPRRSAPARPPAARSGRGRWPRAAARRASRPAGAARRGRSGPRRRRCCARRRPSAPRRAGWPRTWPDRRATFRAPRRRRRPGSPRPAGAARST